MKQNQSKHRIRNNIKWLFLTLKINIGLVSGFLFSSLPSACGDFITAGIKHWMTWQSAFSPTGKYNLLTLRRLGQSTICWLELLLIMTTKAIAADNISQISTSCRGSHNARNLYLRLCFPAAQIIAQ